MKVHASMHPEKGIFEFSLSTRDDSADDSRGCGDRVSSCQNKQLVAATGNDEFNSCGVLSSSFSAACPNQYKDEKEKNLPRKIQNPTGPTMKNGYFRKSIIDNE